MYAKLAGLQYKIIYKRGCDNTVADALSRFPHQPTQLLHLSQCKPTWVQEIIQGYQQDPQAQVLLTQLAVSAENKHLSYTLRDGLICHKGRLWLGNNIPLQLKVITTLHDSASGGHSGVPVTYRRVKQLFAWK